MGEATGKLWSGGLENHTIFPQGNGQIEKMNRTLLMLKTHTSKQTSTWKESLNELMFS